MAGQSNVLKLLGPPLSRQPESSITDLRDAVRRGLPYHAFESIRQATGLSQQEFSAVLGISNRTIARRREERQLTAAESDRLYRVARTLAHAVSALGSIEKARDWCARENRALGGEAPIALLDTDIGVRQVEDVLLRIEHGIYS